MDVIDAYDDCDAKLGDDVDFWYEDRGQLVRAEAGLQFGIGYFAEARLFVVFVYECLNCLYFG